MSVIILEVKNLKKHFPVSSGSILRKTYRWIRAVDGIDFTVNNGETLGLAGESGCGKTTTANVVLRLEKPTDGVVLFQGKDIQYLTTIEYKYYRANLQAVFQDPYDSLSPRLRVGSIIAEPLIVMGNLSKKRISEKVSEALNEVKLHPSAAELYPHEFSGGQRQRIAIARAICSSPKFLVLDEPVSALDVSIRAQIINLLIELQEKLGLSYLVIAHNLATLRHMSTRIAIMYLGKMVELASSDELCNHPLHPYSQALLSASLDANPESSADEIILSGEVPSPLNPPRGCRFHTRCFTDRVRICSEEAPALKEVGPGHLVACHLYE